MFSTGFHTPELIILDPRQTKAWMRLNAACPQTLYELGVDIVMTDFYPPV